MTADAVTDKQLGKFYRKTRALSERLGKSVSYSRLMDVLQAMHDGTVVTADVRRRVMDTENVAVVPGFQEKGFLVSDVLMRLQRLYLGESVVKSFGADLEKKVKDVNKDRWRRFEVLVADTHQSLFRDLDITRFTTYADDEVYRFFVHLAEALRLQTQVPPEPGVSHNFFDSRRPTYLYLMKNEMVFVAKLCQLERPLGAFNLTIETDDAVAVEGATIYCRFD